MNIIEEENKELKQVIATIVNENGEKIRIESKKVLKSLVLSNLDKYNLLKEAYPSLGDFTKINFDHVKETSWIL